MAKEWIDVADTAIKIGLGSLITGFFTYIGIKLTKASELKKYAIEHKIKLIEDTSENVHEYFSAWLKLNSSIAGISKKLANSEFTDFDYSSLPHIREEMLEVISSWKMRDKAAATLLLLNDLETYNLLKKGKDLQNELITFVNFKKKLPPYDFVLENSKKTIALKSSVQKSLSNCYQQSFK